MPLHSDTLSWFHWVLVKVLRAKTHRAAQCIPRWWIMGALLMEVVRLKYFTLTHSPDSKPISNLVLFFKEQFIKLPASSSVLFLTRLVININLAPFSYSVLFITRKIKIKNLTCFLFCLISHPFLLKLPYE